MKQSTSQAHQGHTIFDKPNAWTQNRKQLTKQAVQQKRRMLPTEYKLLELFATVLEKINLCLGCIYKTFMVYSTSHLFYSILITPRFEHHARNNTDTQTWMIKASENITHDSANIKLGWRNISLLEKVKAAPVKFCWSFVSALTSSEVTLFLQPR